MSATAVPGDLETGRGPPLRIPLVHVLVGLGLLVAAAAVGLATALGVAPGLAGTARLHLLLTGWVCVTIMGAMTQFVPVWSGVGLHSRRLARVQLWLVTVGVGGLVAGVLTGRFGLLWPAGLLALAGFWTFGYNMVRTLARARPWDSTEAHFAVALGFLGLATLAGLTLAVGLVRPVAVEPGLRRLALRRAHVTLAVPGLVLTTVFGALYQLVPMFTNTHPDGIDRRLRRVETGLYPPGVLLLAGGRLVDWRAMAAVGAAATALGVAAFAVVLLRTLGRARAERTPTLSRYVAVALALVGWLVLASLAWLRAPLSAPLGGPVAASVLTVGVVGFVVTGTLYHVVPFLVWVERYSDRIGLADVPAVDDLYDGRLAAADFGCFAAGTLLLAAAPLAGTVPVEPRTLDLAGSVGLCAGAGLFTTNLLLVVSGHVEGGLRGLLPLVGADRAEREPPTAERNDVHDY